MTIETYDLPATEAPLVVRESHDYASGSVALGGTSLAEWSDRDQLKHGLKLVLPDGRRLEIRVRLAHLVRRELDIRVDDVPLEGTFGHPGRRLAEASQFLYFMAAVTGLVALLGLMVTDLGSKDVLSVVIRLLDAAVLFALGKGVKKASRFAVFAALLYIFVDTMFQVRLDTPSPQIGILFLRALVVVLLLRALAAIREHSKYSAGSGAGRSVA